MQDFNGDPIKPGFYFEKFYREIKSNDGYVFYTGEDEFRNRIVWVIGLNTPEDLYVASSQAKPLHLNPNYSQWLVPAKNELDGLVAKLKDKKQE